MNQEGFGYIWRWNGTAWSTLEGVAESGPAGVAQTLRVLPGGDVVAGGYFTGMFQPGFGVIPAANVVRWNGSSWSSLGNGVNDTVHLIAESFDGQLLVGGQFTFAGS